MTSWKNVWRPLKFETVEVLETGIKKYFDSCFEMQWVDEMYRDKDWNREKEDGVYKTVPVKKEIMINIPTVSGLACALETSRRTLIDYEIGLPDSGYKEEFSHTIKNAKQFIESCQENGLLWGKLNAAWTIFSLKNNFDWKDKVESDVNVSWELKTWDLKEISTEELLRQKEKLSNK